MCRETDTGRFAELVKFRLGCYRNLRINNLTFSRLQQRLRRQQLLNSNARALICSIQKYMKETVSGLNRF